jgi:hypothetical protein
MELGRDSSALAVDQVPKRETVTMARARLIRDRADRAKRMGLYIAVLYRASGRTLKQGRLTQCGGLS